MPCEDNNKDLDTAKKRIGKYFVICKLFRLSSVKSVFFLYLIKI